MPTKRICLRCSGNLNLHSSQFSSSVFPSDILTDAFPDGRILHNDCKVNFHLKNAMSVKFYQDAAPPNRLTFSFQGYQYQLCDFQVKAGPAVFTHSENLRGRVRASFINQALCF
ncbi:hypothetical protein R1flu_003803 [Riccia fluitans]|uniref:Uncharacterized protein n=1 Tax=Riccia fluitans TaxID=41844 RepID=A0ABD1YA74_9MARC